MTGKANTFHGICCEHFSHVAMTSLCINFYLSENTPDSSLPSQYFATVSVFALVKYSSGVLVKYSSRVTFFSSSPNYVNKRAVPVLFHTREQCIYAHIPVEA